MLYKTPDAAKRLNCSVDFPKIAGRSKEDFKMQFVLFPWSKFKLPILWDVELIQQVFIERGVLRQEAEAILRETVGN